MADDWGNDDWGNPPASANNSSTSGPPAKKVKTDDWDEWGSESSSANKNTSVNTSQAKESITSDWGDDWGGSSRTSTTAATTGWTGNGGGSSVRGGRGGGSSGDGNGSFQNNNSTWGSKPGWGQGSGSATIIKDKGPIQMASMLKVEKMSVDTTHSDIRTHFGRFGTITRLVLEYRFDEERVNCFLDFEKAESAEKAIKFLNGKKLKNREITVMLNPFTPTASTTSDSSGGDWGGGSSGGGGGFGGGGGRGNGRTGGGSGACFKCGESGHFSRECPNPGSGGGGGGRGRGPLKCYKCQGEGHMSRECPQNGTSNSSNTASTDSFAW